MPADGSQATADAAAQLAAVASALPGIRDFSGHLVAIGRVPGWIANWREMNEDPRTKIGRPQQLYMGSPQRDWPQH